MSATKRLMKIITKQDNRVIDEGDETSSTHHEFIGAVDESTDDDGSVTYIEDYEINENGDEDGAFFIEYVTEDDDNLLAGDSNEAEYEVNQFTEFADVDAEIEDDGDGEGDDDADADADAEGDCDENNDELYNCNICGMNFRSVNEHIDQYHPGQDVLIDIPEENGPSIKKEKPLNIVDPLEYQEYNSNNEDDSSNLITSDSININDGELIVYGEESLENEHELMDEMTDDDEQSEVYTYDGATGSLTKTTNAKSQRYTKIANKLCRELSDLYECQQCDALFESLKALCSHKIATHGREISGSANKPPKRLVNATKLKSKPQKYVLNEDTVAKGSIHICMICNTKFHSAKSLKLHARMHLPVKSKTIDEATEHDADASNTGEQEPAKEKFYCDICGKYYDKTFEQVHVQMHNGNEKYNCGICNKVFPNEESINMHKNAHQDTRVIKTKAELNNIKLPYGCQFCGKEFARPHEKVKHERVHTGEKPYECELCGKCFRVSYCLTIHMRTHTDARPYVCPQCNKRFKAQSVYNHHLLTHSDERNYKCPYCPKTFKTSVQLSGHKNSHTKPFTCTECNRPFGSLYAVRAHMESHKRPNHNLKHICEICGAKYARRFALNDHMKEQHKEVQVVHIVDSNNTKKSQPKRTRKVKQIQILEEDDEREMETAGQSILPNMVEQEITISEIENFDNEEEVVEMDWLK